MDLSFNYTFEWEGIIGACKTFQHLRRMESAHIISASYIHWHMTVTFELQTRMLLTCTSILWSAPWIFEFFAHRCKFYLLLEQGWPQQIHFYRLHCIIISLTVLSIPTVFKITPHGTQDIPHIHDDIPMVLNVHSTGCRAAQPKNIITWPHLKSDLCNLSQFQLNTSLLPPPPPPQKKNNKKYFQTRGKCSFSLQIKSLKN